ncbi:MAG TPA: peptide chain release factor N(5)-glutamine methyltransferase [Rhizomicrobium sp.]
MSDLLREAAERLRAAGIESPRAEARILWEQAEGQGLPFESLVARRLRHEPVAYITGQKEFWSLDFDVGPGVLIPRPETETLIEAALRELPDRNGAYHALDLGIGTGCLLIAFLGERPMATGVGLDCSKAALHWARRNVAKHGLERHVELLQGGWEAASGSFDLIVSNPPYIPTGDLRGLPPDVRDHEPEAALDGGPDGLEAYRAIAPILKRHLKLGALALLEIGAGQHQMVGEIVAAAGLDVARIAPDLAGTPRCVVIRAP